MKWLDRLHRFGPGILVATLAAVGVFNSVMNNAYQVGSTFFDSAEFATVIWRSGIKLDMGPTFAGSIYSTHASTINYIPALFSYLWMGDRMNFYGLVYALMYAATLWVAYILMLPLLPRRFGPVLAALGTAVFFCGQIIYDGAWEMRSDLMAPLFMMLAFRSWQLRQYRLALLWFALNNMVREDMGIMILVPVVLLSGLQYLSLRRKEPLLAKERLLWGIRVCAMCIVWVAVTIHIQKGYFPTYDLFQDQYYDRVDPFKHLTPELIDKRLNHLWNHARGIWAPLVVLGVIALCLRDLQLMIGAVAFMPYIVGMFFSKSDMSAEFGSYKAFLFPLCVMWPAIMACGKPADQHHRYAIIQALVLMCGLLYLKPYHWDNARNRWLLQPLTANAQLYRDFGEKQLAQEITPDTTRASHAVLALYPYQFQPYWISWIVSMKKKDANKVQTLIWFASDRDQPLIDHVLKTGEFIITKVEGTKIRVAHRKKAN